MCGIAGVVGRADEGVVAAVRAMAGALAHRGPDGSAVVAARDGRCVLGHTRLAIIDLSDAAAQPMASADGAVSVVFNGEIYNFRELRDRLRGRGHAFRTRSDTEAILVAYEAWGADRFVEELDGMFAFALWDAGAGRLVLARDRAGKKPLFVASRPGATWFASELAALRAGGVPLALDRATLPAYLARGYVPAPETIAKDVALVEPGCAWTFDATGAPRGRRRYWTHPALRGGPGEGGRGGYERDVDVATMRVRRALEAAVERRLVSDVPLGAFLSGGVDSAAVVALMARATGRRPATFTIGFRGPSSWNETDAARETAQAIGTDHEEQILGPEDAMVLEPLVARCGEPLADSSIVPTYLVSRLARRKVTVALTGDGGDELFAGYRRFLVAELAGRVPRRAGALVAAAMRRLPDPEGYANNVSYARRFALLAGRPPGVALMEMAGAFRPADALSLSGEEASGAAVDALAAPETRAIETARALGHEGVHPVLAANFETYLPGDLMTKADRATMAVSLEARAPFLDTALLEVAAGIAPGLHVRRLALKWLLRRAVADVVPAGVLRRPKHGFGIPVGLWMRGELRDWADGLVGAGRRRLDAAVDGARVDALWREHLSGARDHSNRLWALAALECWLRWTAAEAPVG